MEKRKRRLTDRERIKQCILCPHWAECIDQIREPIEDEYGSCKTYEESVIIHAS